MCLWYHTVVSYELSFRVIFNLVITFKIYDHHEVGVRVMQVLCCWNYCIKCYENVVISMKYISQKNI